MNLQTFLANIATFLDETLLPFLLAIGAFVFLWNAVRYFIIDGANHENQEKARILTMWGIIAFVFILSLWGIVKMMVASLNLGNLEDPITPDYIQGR